MSAEDDDRTAKVPQLNDGNYYTWAARMKAALIRKDLWTTVGDPRLSTPRQRQQAQAEILLRVGDELIHIVEDAASPRDAWEYLKSRFDRFGSSRRSAL
jgi:hypothetical protein